MRILFVEDDSLLGEGLCAVLARSGFAVTWVRNGAAALQAVAAEDYLAVLLDIGLPDISGLDVLQKLRADGRTLPVLMLTARDTTRDKVTCFDYGADDFLVKTSDMEELIARLRALIRRSGRSGVLRAGSLTLDVSSHSVMQHSKPVSLSNREFDILRALMEGAGRILTRQQLEQSIYGWNDSPDSNAVEVHIHNLRVKIGATTLKTIRGVGYTLSIPAP